MLGQDFYKVMEHVLILLKKSVKLEIGQVYSKFNFAAPPNSETVVLAGIKAEVPTGVLGITHNNRVASAHNLAASRVLATQGKNTSAIRQTYEQCK